MTATISVRIASISISAFNNASLVAHPLVARWVAIRHKSAGIEVTGESKTWHGDFVTFWQKTIHKKQDAGLRPHLQ
jgi:hypothetical protein